MIRNERGWIRFNKMVLLGVIVLGSCESDPPAPTGPKVGDTHEGGIVFYVDPSGSHGLVAATEDHGTADTWINLTFFKTGATSTTDGAANTTTIIDAQGDMGTYAAKLCRDYRGGGFDDWFLPSKDQLNRLYTKKVVVGGFSNANYWSSTEKDPGEAWVQDFENGTQHTNSTSDNAGVHTRAVRAY